MMIILILLNISFLTLYEQYLIGLSQNRVGPSVNSVMGIFQAIFDGIKLLKKQNLLLIKMNFFSIFMCFLTFIFSFLFWLLLNFKFYFLNMLLTMMMFITFISFSVFMFMLIGLFNKSKYSFIGSMRFSNQSISFEIMFFFMMFIIMILNSNFKFCFYYSFWNMMILIMLLFVVLTELNRSPFDFSEGESELVSGFNTELSSLNFVMVFMSEYNMILFFSVFMSLFFNNILFFFFTVFIMIFIRCSFPRYRLDLLMSFFWLLFLFLLMMLSNWIWILMFF